jgi:hypothetical protein
MIVDVVTSVVGKVREVSIDSVSVESVSLEATAVEEAETVAKDEYGSSTVDEGTGRHGPATTALAESTASAPATNVRQTIVKRVTKDDGKEDENECKRER